jgi:hypothetical protein
MLGVKIITLTTVGDAFKTTYMLIHQGFGAFFPILRGA